MDLATEMFERCPVSRFVHRRADDNHCDEADCIADALHVGYSGGQLSTGRDRDAQRREDQEGGDAQKAARPHERNDFDQFAQEDIRITQWNAEIEQALISK